MAEWTMPNDWQQPGFFGSPSGGVMGMFRGPGSMGPNSVSDPGAMSGTQLMAGIPSVGGAAGAMGSGLGAGLGMNIGTGQLALGGLSALSNVWTGFQAQKLAKEQFDFTKNMANTNLRNQTQSYNTQLDDRARVRGIVEGQSQAQVDDYKERNRLRV